MPKFFFYGVLRQNFDILHVLFSLNTLAGIQGAHRTPNLPTYLVHPQRTLLKVAVAVELVVHECVPAVRVHVARLLVREVAGGEAGDLWPCGAPTHVQIGRYCTTLPHVHPFIHVVHTHTGRRRTQTSSCRPGGASTLNRRSPGIEPTATLQITAPEPLPPHHCQLNMFIPYIDIYLYRYIYYALTGLRGLSPYAMYLWVKWPPNGLYLLFSITTAI